MRGSIETISFEGRDTHVYLPPSYNGQTSFPAVYVQDGSYLFADSLKELEDDFAQGLTQEVLFVGIEPEDRCREYTPWYAEGLLPDEQFSGEGDRYLDFVTEKVIPFIQTRYNVLDDPRQRGITGGSLGALISLFAAYRKPAYFSRIALMSASLWYENMLAYIEANPFAQDELLLYMYVGELEAKGRGNIMERMVPNTREAHRLLKDKMPGGERHIRFETDPEGVHEHRNFNQYFPNAMRFIYPGANS
ncbi:putative alpha/beta superfamily hydrolase [Paenibacillus phyllosphaerae]|uniref:Putative alpha/beta superfamily hydrolase n=1 Tax=Paenibacillus phyllosphaerae TaxID=274593 RepID=A0A7W5B5A3_9BACL|nr:alpha/beta hydrolase-fold protein [Paenibacillus phyllosphaerae]MBB3114664.1 putative alpha/beta superfamily hydrolase [Paenibacillus phyllosphaerae]